MILALLGCGAPELPPVAVPVAARDLAVGVHITADDLRLVPMRPELVPPGVILNPAVILGRVPASRILADEPIRSERLADRELQVALERMVPPGLEVTVFDLDPAATHLPTPGAERVDVVRAGGGVVLSELPVLRVDGERVAVMATPEQVRELSALQREERLTVVPSGAQALR